MAQKVLVLVEAPIKARDAGINRILVLSNDRRLSQICNNIRKPSWQEQTLTLDLFRLQQQGLTTHVHFVPKLVVLNVLQFAIRATKFPVHSFRLNPSQACKPFCNDLYILMHVFLITNKKKCKNSFFSKKKKCKNSYIQNWSSTLPLLLGLRDLSGKENLSIELSFSVS